MKKYILIAAFAAIAGVSFGQLKSSVIKNTVGTEVFSINYGSGVATAKVGVVEAGTVSSGVLSVNNITAAGTVSAFSVTVSSKTGLVSSAAALAAPTNPAASAGFRIRVNGTNYIIALYPN